METTHTTARPTIALFGANIEPLARACPCWMCQTALSARAAFCHECGTIQPPREEVDHFTRLGFERRYDIDLKTLEQRYTTMTRVFERERYHTKGRHQQELADKQAAHLASAYHTLQDPMRRADYLMTLIPTPIRPANNSEGSVLHLRDSLDDTTDGAEIDRIALTAQHAHESALKELSQAFREQNFSLVTILLARLAELEDIAALARTRRASL